MLGFEVCICRLSVCVCVCVQFTYSMSNIHIFIFDMLLQWGDGSVQPTEVLPGAVPRLPAAHGSAGPGAGVAAAAHLSAESPPLDVR